MPSYALTSDFWQLVFQWQTLIAGVFAFAAGLIAYLAGVQQARATKRASNAQIALVHRKDRAQAIAVATAVYADVLEITRIIEEKRLRFERVEKELSGKLVGQSVVGIIETIGIIHIPEMFLRCMDQLFVLGEFAGPRCVELASHLFQYNAVLSDATAMMVNLGAQEWAAQGLRRLEAQLASLGDTAAKCIAELGPIRAGTGNRAGGYPV